MNFGSCCGISFHASMTPVVDFQPRHSAMLRVSRGILHRKEALWMATFIHKELWGALAGVAVFLAYYPWREVWREHQN
jgi:hypothetical protein